MGSDSLATMQVSQGERMENQVLRSGKEYRMIKATSFCSSSVRAWSSEGLCCPVSCLLQAVVFDSTSTNVPVEEQPDLPSSSFASEQHLHSSRYFLDCLGNVLVQAENLGQLFMSPVFAQRSRQSRQVGDLWGPGVCTGIKPQAPD